MEVWAEEGWACEILSPVIWGCGLGGKGYVCVCERERERGGDIF